LDIDLISRPISMYTGTDDRIQTKTNASTITPRACHPGRCRAVSVRLAWMTWEDMHTLSHCWR